MILCLILRVSCAFGMSFAWFLERLLGGSCDIVEAASRFFIVELRQIHYAKRQTTTITQMVQHMSCVWRVNILAKLLIDWLQRWSKLGLNLVQTWSRLGPNLVQTWSKLGLNLV